MVSGWVALAGGKYLLNFHFDARGNTPRRVVAGAWVDDMMRLDPGALAVTADPAPYNCPPVDFSRTRVFRVGSEQELLDPKLPWNTRVG